MIKGFWILGICLLIGLGKSQANNVTLTGPAKVDSVGKDRIATVKLKLSWDNSWRDDLNWDAVYLFIKYRVDRTDGLWHHAYLEPEGHQGSGLSFLPAKSGQQVTGVFVQRASNGAGKINETEIELRWNIMKGTRPLTKQEFDKGKVDLAAFAIEMVYVPYGAFLLGDGAATNSFCATPGNPVLIDADGTSVTLKSQGGDVALSSSYPKGYNGFYCMKYETSQEQYVRFLNKLTYEQQKERIGNDLEILQPGEYVFGDKDQPNLRNGIVLTEKEVNKPAVFGHDFNHDGTFDGEGDGQTIACNYLTPQDMLAYCSWAGLRPMSELEYEKACRLAYPEKNIVRGYAWNNATVKGRAGGATNQGRNDEKPDQGNVNSGNHFGPLRCGSFAGANTYQEEAGASSWGIMELSGNLSEMCYNTNGAGSAFNGAHGVGMLTTSLTGWPTSAGHFGVRGGSFASPDSLLQVSDRSQVTGTYFKDINRQRDSSVTFRAVHTLESKIFSSGSFDAGAISCENGLLKDTICSEAPYCYVISEKDAEGGIGIIRYVWYVKEDNGEWKAIEGQTGETLVFSKTTNAKVYAFKRKALCAGEDAFSNEVTLMAPEITLTTTDLTMAGCKPAMATAVLNVPGKITWLTKEGQLLKTDSSVNNSAYSIDYTDMGLTPGTNITTTMLCRAEVLGCRTEKTVNISVTAATPSFSIAVRTASAVSPKKSLPIVVTGVPIEAKVMWYFNDKPLLDRPMTGSTTPTFTPTFAIFGTGGTHTLEVRVEQNGCLVSKALPVHVTDETAAVDCPASVTDEDDPAKNTYTVRKMADGRCWMVTNIRRTDVAFFYPNSVAGNAAAHGCHYDWTVAMAGSTQERARGICPKGWHIPTDDEWKSLEMAITNEAISTLDAAGWRGSSAGTLKVASGFNMTLSGINATSAFNSTGYYWSSTPSGGSAYYYAIYPASYGNRTARDLTEKSSRISVRCVMD